MGEFLMNPKNLLIIKFNRVDNFQKINIKLHVQTKISFEKRNYQLKSFICHEGEEVLSGHYKAYSYCKDGKVRMFDDCGAMGIPVFETVEDAEVKKQLEMSYILFFELLPEDYLDSQPLEQYQETPPRASKAQQQSHTLEHPPNPQLTKFMSPEAKQSPKYRRLQAYENDQNRQREIIFSKGEVTDCIFVRKEGEVWSKDNLQNFFVIIPGSTILLFRVANKSVEELKTQQLLEYLLQPTGLPFIVPHFQNRLYYKDTQLQPDVNLLNFSADKKGKGNVTFILEKPNLKLNHSGLLFTCEDCEGEETSIQDDNKKLLMGATRLERFEPNHTGHTLMFADLFNLNETLKNTGSKKRWGGNRDKNKKPYGCPKDQPAAAPQKVVSQAPAGVKSQDSTGNVLQKKDGAQL